MSTAIFTSLHGQKREIDLAKAIVRPAAYAVIIRDGAVLLMKVKKTGRWFFPGGGLEPNEDLSTGLQREVSEETGLTLRIGQVMKTKEHFFYYDPLDEAYRMQMTFVRCQVAGGVVVDKEAEDDAEATSQPQWVKISTLQLADFDDVLHEVVEQLMREAK